MKKELCTRFDARQYMQDGDFEIFYYNDPGSARVVSHQHDYYECYFFLEGNVDYEIDKTVYHLNHGDCLLIPPGIAHHPIFRTENSVYRRFVLWISAACYDRLCASCPDIAYGFESVKQNRRFHFHTDFIQFQELQGLFMDMIEESHSERPFKDLALTILLSRFLLQISRTLYGLSHPVSAENAGSLYLSICEYIHSHLEEDLSLDALAASFYVSKYHISHVFKENMGISLHQYVLKKRLQACKSELLSGVPITQLYQKFGFHDHSGFYRAFRREFGLSPADFRDRHATAADAAPHEENEFSNTR